MFNSENFKKAWDDWKSHKTQRLGSPYTELAEERALSALFKKCHGVEDLAIQSIENSIENNWAAIYVNSVYNGYKPNNGGTTAKTGGTSTDRMEALRKW